MAKYNFKKPQDVVYYAGHDSIEEVKNVFPGIQIEKSGCGCIDIKRNSVVDDNWWIEPGSYIMRYEDRVIVLSEDGFKSEFKIVVE